MLLLVGDDWAEDHHDVELMDAGGATLARARVPEGAAGMARLHALIGAQLGEDTDAEVRVGIETDRGLWVTALVAAGYQVFGINPRSVARYRERHVVSGAKSDTADAHVLADMVRTDARQLRPVAADSPAAQAVKVVARAHKTLVWERVRQADRLRHQLRPVCTACARHGSGGPAPPWNPAMACAASWLSWAAGGSPWTPKSASWRSRSPR